ncbi:restriction endonuclease [Chryseobacterium indoltheticum]|nr:hypothetical protein [Chryseobacterium indoltheticum]
MLPTSPKTSKPKNTAQSQPRHCAPKTFSLRSHHTMGAQSFLRGQWVQFIAIGRLRNWQEDSVTQKPKDNGEKILNIIVETKDIDKESFLRKIEDAKIDCAKEFFNHLTIDGYKAEFKTQLNNKRIRQIIDEIFAE